MDRLLQLLQENEAFIRQWGYLALFFASWAEGLNSMIIGGFLVATGKLGFFWVCIAMASGHILSGFSWYGAGYVGGAKLLERWGHRIRLTPQRIAVAQSYFEKHSGKALFVAKFTVGFTITTLLLAGILKMHFKKFALYNFLGSVAWTGATLFFGYSFGLSF